MLVLIWPVFLANHVSGDDRSCCINAEISKKKCGHLD